VQYDHGPPLSSLSGTKRREHYCHSYVIPIIHTKHCGLKFHGTLTVALLLFLVLANEVVQPQPETKPNDTPPPDDTTVTAPVTTTRSGNDNVRLGYGGIAAMSVGGALVVVAVAAVRRRRLARSHDDASHMAAASSMGATASEGV
jgi:hypothetical protein